MKYRRLIVLTLAFVSLCSIAASAATPAFTIPYVDTDSTKKVVKPTEEAEPTPVPVYKKGIDFYTDFGGIPDFRSHAKLTEDNIVGYPLYTESFYYLENPGTAFTYSKKIMDYIYVNPALVEAYKEYLQSLGYFRLKSIAECEIGEYQGRIQSELMYDPDFKLDANGVFFIDNDTDFTLLLIGKSVTYNKEGKLTECVELRFYQLNHAAIDPVNITSFAAEAAAGASSNLRYIETAYGVRVYFSLPDITEKAPSKGYDGYTDSVSLPSLSVPQGNSNNGYTDSVSDFARKVKNNIND